MKRRRWGLVIVAFALVVAACGGSGLGAAPTGPVVAAKPCVFYPVAHALQSCHSPGKGGWVVSLRYNPHGPCTLLFSRAGKHVWTYHGQGYCSQESWAKPDLLLYEDDFVVERVNASTHSATPIAGFGDFVVSPNWQWIAGDNGAEPQDITHVFVIAIRGGKCLVVPHTSAQTDISAKGFAPDSKSVIVLREHFSRSRGGQFGKAQLVQVPLTSLRAGCPSEIAKP